MGIQAGTGGSTLETIYADLDGPVSRRCKERLWWKLATVIDAGIPIVQGLEILARMETNERLRQIILAVNDMVKDGKNLSTALHKFPRAFDKIDVNLVAAGEAGGILDRILSRLASKYAFERKTRRRTAFLPLRWYYAFSSLFWSPLSRMEINAVNFCRTLCTLLCSGVPILDSLDLVKGTMPVYLRDAVEHIRQQISEGKNMADTMRAQGVFPPLVAELIDVGEQSGTMDSCLRRIAEYYEQRLCP